MAFKRSTVRSRSAPPDEALCNAICRGFFVSSPTGLREFLCLGGIYGP